MERFHSRKLSRCPVLSFNDLSNMAMLATVKLKEHIQSFNNLSKVYPGEKCHKPPCQNPYHITVQD